MTVFGLTMGTHKPLKTCPPVTVRSAFRRTGATELAPHGTSPGWHSIRPPPCRIGHVRVYTHLRRSAPRHGVDKKRALRLDVIKPRASGNRGGIEDPLFVSGTFELDDVTSEEEEFQVGREFQELD